MDDQNQGCQESSYQPALHEMDVHGSVVKQTLKVLDEHQKPTIAYVTADNGKAVPVLLYPDGRFSVVEADSFDAYLETPRFREGNALLLDLDSFIAHTQRFADSDTVVFADNNRSSPSLHSVLDYHRAGAESEARFGRHTADFQFPLSDEWKAWCSVDGKKQTMRDFATFLEDRIIDVLPSQGLELNEDQQRYVNTLGGDRRIADPAKLMELSTGLQVFEESEVQSAIKLQTGEAKMAFTSKHTDGAGGDLSVPSMFVLGIPVFTNGPEYQILVRLRYRKHGAELFFFTEMWRTDRVFDHAFDESLERVRQETNLPVLLGKPEGRSAF